MKRNKIWWARLSKNERKRLFHLEHTSNSSYGGGGYLPDDCSECGGCGNPMMGSGLYHNCYLEIQSLINKGNI